MLPVKTRAHRIKTRLDRHFMYTVDIAVARPEPTWWREQARVGALGPMCPLGFGWPVPNPDHLPNEDGEGTSAIIMGYSPEIINDQTQDLTDDELDDYIIAVQWYGDMHIVLWEEEDPKVRHDQIMETMETDLPMAARLFKEQLALLGFRQELDGLD